MPTRRKKPNLKRTIQQDSPLLALPAEIRISIYEMAFEGAVIKVDFKDRPSKVPGLLVTCRQIYHEAIDLYYAAATIYSVCPYAARYWLTLFSRSRSETVGVPRRNVQKILLDHGGDYWSAREGFGLDSRLRRNIREWKAQNAAEQIDETRQSVRGVSSDRFKVSILAPNQEMIWTTNPVAVSRTLEEEWAGEYTCPTSVD